MWIRDGNAIKSSELSKKRTERYKTIRRKFDDEKKYRQVEAR